MVVRALAGAMLAALLGGCAARNSRMDELSAQSAAAVAGSHAILEQAERRAQEAADRAQASAAEYRRTSERVFAADRRDRRLHPERYRGTAPPPSLAYEHAMSGAGTREDDFERQLARDRDQDTLDRNVGDMEREIDRGQWESRHEPAGVWPDACTRAHARRGPDCWD